MLAKRINVFISHYGGDEEYIPRLKNLLKNQDYEISDSSIVETKPNNATNTEYIRSLLRAKIDWAGTVLVLIGPHTHEREWVDWEIEYAARNDKRIVGVFIQGATDSDVPESLLELGDSCVAWNSDKLARAIEGETIWHDSAGQPRRTEEMRRGIC